jgi:hypothetical protein
MTLDYDAQNTPDPGRWLAADEDERMQAVLAYHEGLDNHPEAESMQAHAGVHAAVETQLVKEDPPVVREKMDELLEAGIDRHAAIHALAVPLSHVMYGVVDEDDVGDAEDVLAHKIEQVTIEDGRAQERTWDRARGEEEQTVRRRKRRPDPEGMKRSRSSTPDDD